MNEKSLFVSIAALVIVAASAFGFGYYFSKPSAGTDIPPLGAITVPSVSTTTHGTALQSSLLFQWQSNVVDSLRNVRAPLALVSSTNVTLDWPALPESGASSTVANVTSTAFTGVAAGDFVLVSFVTTSSAVGDPGFWVSFVANGCATDVVCIRANNASGSAVNILSNTFRLRLLPDATFVRPATIDVTTTTTPYSQ